jgi:hypothetical protein
VLRRDLRKYVASMAWRSTFSHWPRTFIWRTPGLNSSLSAARQRHSTMSEIAIAEIALSGLLAFEL